jgi:hypothetical protein
MTASSSSSSSSSIEATDSFFSRMISMIPRELYTHNGSDSNAEENNSKYYKHRKVPLAPDEKKLASKKKLQSKYGVVADDATGDKDEDAMDVVIEDEIRSSNKNNTSRAATSTAPAAVPGTINAAPAPNNSHSEDADVGTLDDLRQRLQVRGPLSLSIMSSTLFHVLLFSSSSSSSSPLSSLSATYPGVESTESAEATSTVNEQ